jgi:hypothetical protein
MDIILCETTLILFVIYASINTVVTYKMNRKIKVIQADAKAAQ